MDPSTSGGDVGHQDQEAAVFLSHSGAQKVFVERLYDALERAHQTAFFDKYSLERGSYFPSDIKRALRGCKLGVIVLSNDFLSSMWPMIEVEILLSEGIRVLPLFYQITTEELKRPEKLSEWKRKWTNMETVTPLQVELWEEAVKKLRSTTGEVHIQSENELVYIERVVKAVCSIIPSNIVYDLSYVQGQQRLVKEIGRYFDNLVDAARHCEKACMVGLHATGGSGKTTLCKSMVNFFTSQYLGKSCLIEFPTDCDKKKVVLECQTALKKLTNLNDDVLDRSNDFDQVVRLMRDHVAKLNVFIAIDNVWAHFEEEARKLLGVGFNAASKVLLMSRSEHVLKGLLSNNLENSYIDSLPAPEEEDAFLIFQKSVGQGDITSSPVRNVIDKCLKRCIYNGKYHPLALKALGGYTRSQLRGLEVSKMDQSEWSHIFGGIDSTALQSVENAIKLSYKGLEERNKHIFLDLIFCIPCYSADKKGDLWRYQLDHADLTKSANLYWMSVDWLCCLNNFTNIQITKALDDLALAGVIQIEKDEIGSELIGVHDLYTDLAWKEVAASPRFFISETDEALKRIEWEELERVFLGNKHEQGRFVEKLRLRKCPKIQALIAWNIETRTRGVHSYLQSMPSLRFLILTGQTYERARFAANNPYLRVLRQQGVQLFERVHNFWEARETINLNGLVQLTYMRVVKFDFVKRFEGLHSLLNLRHLRIRMCPRLEKLEGLERLTELEFVDVRICKALKKVAGLGGVTSLKRLRLESNKSLEEVETQSPALRRLLVIYNCSGLRTPNVLQLWRKSAAQFLRLNLHLLPGLEHLRIEESEDRKIWVGKMSRLRRVEVRKCEALEEIEGLGELLKLEEVVLQDCERLEDRCRHVNALRQREGLKLDISGCPRLEAKVE